MVQRMTGVMSGLRAYTGGGARALIDTINDGAFMQESSNATGMKGESWGTMESPQNYGFTSVVADAVKSAKGQIDESAEGFVSFMGGNRNFPVMGVMDDRRHRLFELAKDAAKGSTAMFGLKEWGQQLLNTEKGWFMTGNMEKDKDGNARPIKLQLVKNKNGQQQQQGQGGSSGGAGAKGFTTSGFPTIRKPDGRLVIQSASGVEFDVDEIPTPRADGGGGGGGSGGSSDSGSQQGGKKKGQKTLHKEESDTFHEISPDHHHLQRGQGNHKVQDKKIINYYQDETKSNMVDDRHSHIRYVGNRIFVDEQGCWTTKAIQIKPDPDQSAATILAWEQRQERFRADNNPLPALISSTAPQDIDAWLSNNVNDLDQARALLGHVIKYLASHHA
jgi:phage gp45-like